MQIKYVVEHHRPDMDEPVEETYDHPAHIPYNRPEYRMAIMLEDFEGSHIKFVPAGNRDAEWVTVYRVKYSEDDTYEPF